MAKRPWLEDVRRRLAKHALPADYIDRFVEELSDHLQDIEEESMSTEASVHSRLGEPGQVAEAAAVAYRRRSFLGRHRAAAFLVFGVSPLVAFVALSALAAFGTGVLFDAAVERLPIRFGNTAWAASPYGMSLLSVIIPSVFVSIVYCKLARRSGIRRTWMLLSCAVIAALAATPLFYVRYSDTPGGNALLCVIAIPQYIEELPKVIPFVLYHPWQVFQFLCPLAIGAWFMRRNRDRGRSLLTPEAPCEAA